MNKIVEKFKKLTNSSIKFLNEDIKYGTDRITELNTKLDNLSNLALKCSLKDKKTNKISTRVPTPIPTPAPTISEDDESGSESDK